MASPNRERGGGLSMQTVVVASSASLAAALVTSRLFPAGTVYTAALTPVIVAMVSEMLHRPVNRMTDIRQARRTAVRAPDAREPVLRGAGFPDRGFREPEYREPEYREPGYRAPEFPEPAMSVHGRRRFGRIHPRVVIGTGLMAFVVAAGALTLPELLFGGAVANDHRTTIFGGAKKPAKNAEQPQDTTKTTTQTQTETTPAQQAPTTTTETAPSETTPTETAPSGGTPPPAPTTTDTAPAQTPPPSG